MLLAAVPKHGDFKPLHSIVTQKVGVHLQYSCILYLKFKPHQWRADTGFFFDSVLCNRDSRLLSRPCPNVLNTEWEISCTVNQLFCHKSVVQFRALTQNCFNKLHYCCSAAK